MTMFNGLQLLRSLITIADCSSISAEAGSLPAHMVCPVGRTLPLRVRTFVDIATQYMGTVLSPTQRAV